MHWEKKKTNTKARRTQLKYNTVVCEEETQRVWVAEDSLCRGRLSNAVWSLFANLI